MVNKPADGSNNDGPKCAPKTKKDILEDSQQVSSDDNTFHEQEIPGSEATTGSAGSCSDPQNAAHPSRLISASGPEGSFLDLAIDDGARRQPPSPGANGGSPHPHAEGSSTPPNSLKENKEFKTHPGLPDYKSQGCYSPGHLLESKPLSQDTKAYPDLPDYTSTRSSSPGNFLETKARLPGKRTERPPTGTSKKMRKDHPDLSSTNSSSGDNPSETENSDADDNRPTSDLDGDGENVNLGANVPTSDLEDIAPSCVNSGSRLCPETRDDVQTADTVGGSNSVVPAASILRDESSMELGTESDTSEEPMDYSPQSSPPRPRQADGMAPGLTILEHDPCEKSAFSVVNRSLSQEAGPSGGSQELAAIIDGVARTWNSSSSQYGLAHPPAKKSESPPIEISKKELKDFPELPSYTSSNSSTSGDENPDDCDNGLDLVEDNVHDRSLLSGANWRKSVKAVPGIAPAQGISSDSD